MTGANNVTGAMTGTLALFFGTDKVHFSLERQPPGRPKDPHV